MELFSGLSFALWCVLFVLATLYALGLFRFSLVITNEESMEPEWVADEDATDDDRPLPFNETEIEGALDRCIDFLHPFDRVNTFIDFENMPAAAVRDLHLLASAYRVWKDAYPFLETKDPDQ